MNEWAIAAIVLLPILGVCVVLPALLEPVDGLIALEVSGTTGTAILLLLSESLQRQSFADLALIFAALSFIGALGFARVMERRL